MRASTRWLGQIVTLLAICDLPAATAQNAPNGPPTDQGSIALHSSTRLVQLNVVVQGKKGEPVTGLRKDDFTVLDQGAAQQIAVFLPRSALPSGAAAATTVPANVFTNRYDQAGAAPGSVTAILFDALNTALQDQSYARQQVIKFLGQLQPQDHVAIYILTTQIITVSEFTQDSTSLLEAIQQFSGHDSALLAAATQNTQDTNDQLQTRSEPPASARIASQLKQFLDGADGQIRDFANVNRAVTTTSAIEAIANHVAQIPGRKSLIWVSGSFPIAIGFDADSLFQPEREHRTFGPEIERATRALNQANMAIYPVDARGLMTSPAFSAANRSGFNPRDALKPGVLSPDQSNFDTMTMLADRTGGRAFFNTNDLEGAIQRAIADGQYTYTIGFYPTHGKWDGKFHELKVKLADKGYTLRYRKGYFAAPEPKGSEAENKLSLEAAILSPVEWTNLDVQVRLKQYQPDSRVLVLQVALDAHELQFTPNADRQGALVYAIFGQLGEGDKSITSEKETFNLNLKPETYQTLLRDGLKFTGQIVLAPETTRLRVIAQDGKTGTIGTLTIPIKQFLDTKIHASGAAATSPKKENSN